MGRKQNLEIFTLAILPKYRGPQIPSFKSLGKMCCRIEFLDLENNIGHTMYIMQYHMKGYLPSCQNTYKFTAFKT